MLNITKEQQTRLIRYLETVPKAPFANIAETFEFCNTVAIINNPETELTEIQRENLLIFLKKATLTGEEAEEFIELKKVIKNMSINSKKKEHSDCKKA